MPEMTPINQLPDGLTVLLHVGDRYFFGYRVNGRFYRVGIYREIPYEGVLSPYEFRGLTDFERNRLEQKKTHRVTARQAN